SKGVRSRIVPSTIARATARRLQGARRALFSTRPADSVSEQSTITASKRFLVSCWTAVSGLLQCSISISRSLRTRRSTRTVFSSSATTRDCRFIGVPETLPFQFTRESFPLNLPQADGRRCASVQRQLVMHLFVLQVVLVRPVSSEGPGRYLSTSPPFRTLGRYARAVNDLAGLASYARNRRADPGRGIGRGGVHRGTGPNWAMLRTKPLKFLSFSLPWHSAGDKIVFDFSHARTLKSCVSK